jgi:hypothetical protein
MRLHQFISTESFARIAIFLLLISVIGAIFGNWSDGIKKGLIGFWIVIPPLWLWFEFCFLFDQGKTQFPNDFEKFK